MPLGQNLHQTVTRFECVGISMYACGFSVPQVRKGLVLSASAFQCMRAGFLCPKCDNFACLHKRQDQNELHLKRWFFFAKIGIFCKSIAGPLSEAKTHWMVNWLQLQNELNFVWRHTKVFMQNPSQRYLRNIQLLRTTVNWCWWRFPHILPQQQYSRVYALFLAFHALVYRWGCQFLSLFS